MSVYEPLKKKDVLKVQDKSHFLPDGKTCKDCSYKDECSKHFLYFNLDDELCGYKPSRFEAT